MKKLLLATALLTIFAATAQAQVVVTLGEHGFEQSNNTVYGSYYPPGYRSYNSSSSQSFDTRGHHRYDDAQYWNNQRPDRDRDRDRWSDNNWRDRDDRDNHDHDNRGGNNRNNHWDHDNGNHNGWTHNR